MFKIKLTNYNKPQWLPDIAIIFFIVFLFTISIYLIFEKLYENRIYPGVTLGRINLSGKTYEEAKLILNQKVNKINQEGITFYYENNKTVIMPIVASLETDLAYEIINFDIEKTISEAYNFGRNNDIFTNLLNKIKAIILKKQIFLATTINEKKINQALEENFSQFEIPAQDAKLIFKKQILLGEKENFQLDISEEKLGKIIDYKKGILHLKNQLANLNNDKIILLSKTDYPQIYKKDCLNIKNKSEKVLNLAPITLKYEEKEWIIDKKQLSEWVTLKINPDYPANGIPLSGDKKDKEKDKVIVGIEKQIVEQYLQDEIAIKINEEPLEAKFKIKDGRVVEFQASHDGIELDTKKSFAYIETEIIENSNNEIKLIANELKSSISTGEVNDFGVKEIIGIGESNFSGSPKNRKHNIRVGADTLNGILIKPEEEFSLLNALGEIEASTGYLPELVIKDNKTIPEYGGGLCQIGTTMFRAALASGLPITMRRNHSYRVSYYEPAGTDATIYNPWPDFKFINDTGNYVLIQSRIEGNNLYFDFWGSKDGRIVERTDPIIYNIVKPEPTKLIETLDLEPGEKKCTEHAHNGADAYFDYKVAYADGEVKEKRFNSHYVPWREVCLIGVEELSEDEDENDNTATEEIVE